MSALKDRLTKKVLGHELGNILLKIQVHTPRGSKIVKSGIVSYARIHSRCISPIWLTNDETQRVLPHDIAESE